MQLRLEEAIARSLMNGKKVLKKDLAARLFPNVGKSAQQVNLTNLLSGRTTRVKPEWIAIICEMCECDANFLFGIEK